ncbi:MAG: cupin [Myxococcota bacterium]
MTRVFVLDPAELGGWGRVDGPEVAHHLASLGVDYERWPLRPLVAPSPEQVSAAYAPEIERLSARHGYHSVDVVRMTPDHPGRVEARAKFLSEHVHDDDETRFFVEGSGVFYLRLAERVHAVFCEAGDLLRVPAGTRHWFDMGSSPQFCAIRLFTRADGWVATFTGDPIAARMPDYDALARA